MTCEGEKSLYREGGSTHAYTSIERDEATQTLQTHYPVQFRTIAKE